MTVKCVALCNGTSRISVNALCEKKENVLNLFLYKHSYVRFFFKFFEIDVLSQNSFFYVNRRAPDEKLEINEIIILLKIIKLIGLIIFY